MPNARELDIFRKYLERRGLKLTAERRALFDEVFARHEHVEADELLVRLRAKHKKISRATIYRTLELDGYARIDFRLSAEGVLYFLEANPNPEIAESQEFATAAKHDGIAYPDLLHRILALGIRRAASTTSAG